MEGMEAAMNLLVWDRSYFPLGMIDTCRQYVISEGVMLMLFHVCVKCSQGGRSCKRTNLYNSDEKSGNGERKLAFEKKQE